MTREFFDNPRFQGETFVSIDSTALSQSAAWSRQNSPEAHGQLTLTDPYPNQEFERYGQNPNGKENINAPGGGQNQTLATPEIIHTIKRGETLWGIARTALTREGFATPSALAIKLEVEEIIKQTRSSRSLSPISPISSISSISPISPINSVSSVQSIHSTDSPISIERGHLLPGTTVHIPFAETTPLRFSSTTTREANKGSFLEQPRPDSRKESQKESRGRDIYQWHGPYGRKDWHHSHFRLGDIEKDLLSLGKEVIDTMHHWMARVAAKSFDRARREAEEHGIHIQISSAGRTYADQARLYRQLHKRQSVAFPGTSNHETGLAVDVINWRQVKPYLLAHGFVHGDGHSALRHDPWHFKYVGRKAEA